MDITADIGSFKDGQIPVQAAEPPPRSRAETFVRNLWKLIRVPLFLLLLATLCTVLRVCLNIATQWLIDRRVQLYGMVSSFIWKFVIWVSFGVVMIIVSVFWTRQVSILAAGSGIPEIKSMLSGVNLAGHLEFRTLVSKIGGLITTMASGLQMGAEGPFVHVAAIISNLLMKLRIFRFVQNNETLRLKLLSAGCAVGIANNFGAPVGGVLFSVEVTSSFFSVSSLPINFFCAVSGAVMFVIFSTLFSLGMSTEDRAKTAGLDVSVIDERHISAILKISYLPTQQTWELIIFALIGVVMGALGALLVHLNMKIAQFRRKYHKYEGGQYTMPIIVILITAVITCPFVIGNFMSLNPRAALVDLFSPDIKEGNLGWSQSFGGHRSISLLFFALSRLVLVAVSFTLPVPSDVYTPALAIGAAFGRMIGEAIDADYPGGYAVVGAAAFAAGVTRTMSSAVIIFELTGQLKYAYPVLVSVLFAYLTGNKFSLSIYDSVAKYRGIPLMGNFNKQKSYMRTVDEIMNRELFFLTMNPTYLEIEAALDAAPFSYYPVVEDRESMNLVGTIDRNTISQILEARSKYVQFRMKGMQGLEDIKNYQEENEVIKQIADVDDVDFTVDPATVAEIELPALDKLPRTTSTSSMVGGGSGRRSSLRMFTSKSDEDARMEMEQQRNAYRTALEKFPKIRHKFFSTTCNLALIEDQIEKFPFTISDVTQMRKVHFMFSVMGLNHAFVTSGGRLVGVITKYMLTEGNL